MNVPETDRICRDFLRNVCHRGKRCKYVHERSEDDQPTEEYTFCHDFQNGMCHWPGCKFLHATESEEEHFRSTGDLPAHVIARNRANTEKSELPICKDFVKGSCQREKCKFRHCKKKEEIPSPVVPQTHLPAPQIVLNGGPASNGDNNRFEEQERNNGDNNRFEEQERNNGDNNRFEEQERNNGDNNRFEEQERNNGDNNRFEEQERNNGDNNRFEEQERNNVDNNRFEEQERNFHWQLEDQRPLMTGYQASPHPGDIIGPPEPKRRIISGEAVVHFDTSQLIGQQHTAPTITPGYYYPVIARNEARAIVLEDENSLLRKKIEELKKQVSDLTATNEFLLDQNAQLRMSGKRTTNVTAVTVPAVTITNTVPPSQAPTPQQMVNAAVHAAGTLRTVTASVATVPVSIATVTPVSIAAVSMAPVSIAPPIVTMAQQTITMSGSQPSNQQIANQANSQTPGSIPMSISGATAPILSYPIMTHGLRPVPQ